MNEQNDKQQNDSRQINCVSRLGQNPIVKSIFAKNKPEYKCKNE